MKKVIAMVLGLGLVVSAFADDPSVGNFFTVTCPNPNMGEGSEVVLSTATGDQVMPQGTGCGQVLGKIQPYNSVSAQGGFILKGATATNGYTSYFFAPGANS